MARSPAAGRVLPVNQKQQGIARLAKSRGVSQSRGGDTNQAFPSGSGPCQALEESALLRGARAFSAWR